MFRFLLCVSCLAIGGTAHAQDAAEPEATGGDIVVTASRVSSLASKTPVALTAVRGDDLAAAMITNPTNLSDRTPGLSIDRNNGLQITIRGVTSSDNTEKGDPSAAFMVDGVYIARPQAQEVSFYDIARVEVLRGPQGTLFGRNTTAGLVNVITNKPVLGSFSGSGDVTYGNYDTQQANLVLNVPLGEKVALRAAGNYDRRDNYTRPGQSLTSDLDPAKKNISVRVSALVDLGRGELVVRGDYSSIKGVPLNALPASQFYSNFDTPQSVPLYIGRGRSSDELRTLDKSYDGPLSRNEEAWGVMADLQYDLGFVSLNYSGSYRRFTQDNQEAVVSAAPALFASLAGMREWQNSQELRFVTNGSGPLKVQAGAYYFREELSNSRYLMGVLSPTPGTFGYVYGFPQDPAKAESWALFGQATYNLAAGLRATGGVRYSHDEKSRRGATVLCSTLACDQPGDIIADNDAKKSFSKVTWRAGLDYDLNARTLVYATVATGYKAGGFNDGCQVGNGPTCALPAEALYYDPETLTSYEMGVKTRFAGNAVTLSSSLFHYDYKNIQLSTTTDICGVPCQVTTNAAAAKVDGVEVEGVIAPVPTSKLDFALAWLNARYDRFEPQTGVDWSGRKLDRSPDWTISGGFTQTVDLPHGKLEASVHTRVSDSYVIAALGTLNQFRVPSYTKTDLSLVYTAPNDAWFLQGFARNLENSIVVTAVSSGIFGQVQLADPRTYGIRAGFKF